MATQVSTGVFLKQKIKKISHLVTHLKAETKFLKNTYLAHPTATDQQTIETLDEPAQAVVQAFMKKINSLEKELQELKTSNQACQNHKVNLQQELTVLQISSQVCRDQRDKLLIALNCQTDSKILQAEKNVLSKTNNKLQKQVNELALQLDTLQYEHKTASQTWNTEKDTLQYEHKTASQAWQTEEDGLKKELRQLMTAKHTLQTDKYAMQNELKQLKTAKNTWQIDKCALENELKQLKTAKSTWQIEKCELQNKLRQLKTVKNELQNDCHALQTELQQLKSDKIALQADKDSLQEAVQQSKVTTLARQENKTVSVRDNGLKNQLRNNVTSFLCQENMKQASQFMNQSSVKISYQRDFLLALQFKPACVKKPKDLQPIDNVVLDYIEFPFKGMSQSGSNGTSVVFLQWNPTSWKVITGLSMNDDVKLNKAENAWRPRMKRVGTGELSHTEEMFKKVQSILNKLTPQMFDRLMKQVTELAIDTEQILKGVTDLIFEKAIREPNFSFQYGLMCQRLATLEVLRTNKHSTVSFRKLLLDRCKKEFQREQEYDVVLEKKQRKVECASSAMMRKPPLEELENVKDKVRLHSIGLITFIGELYKLKMLTWPIMHHCVDTLLKKRTEQSLECVCKLLSTVGKDLDFGTSRNHMNRCFSQLTEILRECKMSLRLKFMIQDLKYRRHREWVLRRPEQTPKNLRQIHQQTNMKMQGNEIKVFMRRQGFQRKQN